MCSEWLLLLSFFFLSYNSFTKSISALITNSNSQTWNTNGAKIIGFDLVTERLTYTLMVDGVKQTTKPIKITYKKPTKTKAGDDYILEAKNHQKHLCFDY
jgi:hypothetical protein